MLFQSKRILPVIVFVFLVAACSDKVEESTSESVGMANPASVYCASLNGRSEIKVNEDGGQYVICHLPDGTSDEEWELFRRDHPQVQE